jgi:hypothetical protein
MASKNPATGEGQMLTVEEVEASYTRLTRALKFGAAFAVATIVMLLITQPPLFIELSLLLAAVEFFGYRYFSRKYAQTRDDLISAIRAGGDHRSA